MEFLGPEKQEREEWQQVVVDRHEEQSPELLDHEYKECEAIERLLILNVTDYDGQVQEIEHRFLIVTHVSILLLRLNFCLDLNVVLTFWEFINRKFFWILGL